MGNLSTQLLLQFYIKLFETLQVFLSWSEDVHGLLGLSHHFLSTFYPLTNSFGGYSDQHGIHLSVRRRILVHSITDTLRHILIIFGRNVEED